MDPRLAVGLGLGGAAALLVGGLVVANAQKPAAAPAPAAVLPWVITQGHRYQVTLLPIAGQTVDFTKATPPTFSLGMQLVGVVLPFAPAGSAPGLSYDFDALAPTHNEPNSTFLLGLPASAVSVTLYDLGVSPNATATAPAPPAPAPPAPAPAPSTLPTPPATAPSSTTTSALAPAAAVPPTPMPAGPMPSPTGTPLWFAATSIPFAWEARLTMTGAQVVALAAAVGASPPPDLTAPPGQVREILTGLLLSQHVQAVLQSNLVFSWGPGDALPSDWPPDDPNLTDGYHVQLTYGIGFASSTAAAGFATPPTLGIADLSAIGLDVVNMWAETGPTPSQVTQPPSGVTWTLVTQINPQDHVRVSIQVPDAAGLASYSGVPTQTLRAMGDPTCLGFLLMTSASDGWASRNLHSNGIIVWCAGDALPPDWPSDDTNSAGEFHLEFRFGGAASATSALGLPMSVWVAQGQGA